MQWVTVADNNAAGGTHTCTVVSGPGCTQDPTQANGWTRYQTSYTNGSGGPQVVNLSYAAVSAAGGLAAGNLMDDVRITGLVAAVEFSAATASGPETVPTANLPRLLVSGVVAAPQTVEIAITGGTAARGIDYSTVPAAGNLVVTIPAGSYDGTLATAVSLAAVLQILPDPDTPPGPETIEMELVNPSAGIAITGVSTCGLAVAAHTYQILQPPLLSLAKQAPPAFVVGQAATYTLQVTNIGATDTSGTITVTDTVPAGLTIASASGGGWTCNVVSQTVTCTTSQVLVANGGTAPAILINVTPQAPTAGTQVANTASASGGGDSECPAATRCNSGTSTPVNGPTLTLVKQGPPALVVGQAATYSLQVTNNGTAATSATITVTDTVPAGLTIGSAGGSGWTCNVVSQTVTCTTPVVLSANGGAAPVILLSVTPQASTGGTQVTNTASASGGGDPSCPADSHCNSGVTTPVNEPALTLVKQGPAALIVGQPADYTLQVTNTGTAATSGTITVSDPLPGGLTINSASGSGWTCNVAGQTVTCTTPFVLVASGGAAPVITINVTPDASANGQSLTNTATASGGGDAGCPGAPRCSGSFSGPVEAPALALAKSGPSAFVVGQAASYALEVTNNGTAPTSGTITVTDSVPAGLTIDNAGGPGWTCGIAAQTVTCTTAQVLAANGGQAPDIVIDVTPQASANGQQLANSATASGGGDPDCPADPRCGGGLTVPVEAPALELEKQGPSAFVVGQAVDYTLQLTNQGSASTSGTITVVDAVPGGLSINLATGAGWACAVAGQTVTCTTSQVLVANGGVAPVIAINVTPLPSAEGQSLANSASASGGGDPGCPAEERCGSTTTSPVQAPALAIVKQGPAALVVGQPADYTLEVTNTGTAATFDIITVTDPVPGGLSIGSATGTGWACAIVGQTVTCTTSQELAANGGVAPLITITVTPLPGANGQVLSNTATVGGGGDPGCPGAERCNDSTGTPVDAPALALVKQGPSALVVGQPADYVLQVTNTGTAATSGTITITDPIPGGLTINNASGPAWACVIGNQTVVCTTNQVLAAGGGAATPITINVTPQPGAAGQSLSNSATVDGGGDPGCPGAERCNDSTGAPVDAPALSLLKQGPAELEVGQSADYSLVVTNLGTLATSGIITVTDPVPGGLAVNGAGGPGWSCTISGQTVTCTTAQVLAANGGASTPLSITVTAQASAEGQVLANSASTQGGGDLGCPAELRCTAEIAIPVGASSGVEIPTLSGWMLMALALLLMVAGWWRLRAAGARA